MKTETLIDIFENVSNKNKNDLIVFFENLNGMNNVGKNGIRKSADKRCRKFHIEFCSIFILYSTNNFVQRQSLK